MMIKCCQGCTPPKRHVGCHATCEEYKQEKERAEALKEKINGERDWFRADERVRIKRGCQNLRKASKRTDEGVTN